MTSAGVYRVSAISAPRASSPTRWSVPTALRFTRRADFVVSDARQRHIKAFDMLPNGVIAKQTSRVFADLGGPEPGVADGIKVDSAGHVYSGGAGGLYIIDAKGKKLDASSTARPRRRTWPSAATTGRRCLHHQVHALHGQPEGSRHPGAGGQERHIATGQARSDKGSFMKRTLAVPAVLAFLAILAAVPVNASNDFGVQIEFYRDAHKQAEMMAAARGPLGSYRPRLERRGARARAVRLPDLGSLPRFVRATWYTNAFYPGLRQQAVERGTAPLDRERARCVCGVRRRGGQHFRGRAMWEIWNEPNLPQFWAGSPDPAACVALARAAAARNSPGGSPSVDSGPIHRRRDIRLQVPGRDVPGSSTSSTRCRCIHAAPRFLKRPRRSTTKCDAALRATRPTATSPSS